MRYFILIAVLLTFACSSKVDHHGKTPIASVGDVYLYKEDVAALVPMGFSYKDSVDFLNDYIKIWAEDMLFYNMAKSNISNTSSIDELVENYRRNLIINEYQERLVREKMEVSISEDTIRKYYDADRNMYILNHPIVKGVFIKVAVGNHELNRVRKFMRMKADGDRDKLERFTLRGAADYMYFRDEWIDLEDVWQKMPKTADISAIKGDDSMFESKDSAFVYLLHVDSFIPRGGNTPYEIAYNDIKEVIYNEKKAAYIKNVREDLFNRAVENGKFRIIKPE